MHLLAIALVVLMLNVPFGYWRAGVRKFSLQWALAIHIPVPFVVLLRVTSGIGYHWTTYPFMIVAFFAGQQLGAATRRIQRQLAEAA